MTVMKLIFSDERVIEMTVVCGNRNLCSTHLIKAHVFSFAAGTPLPFQEQNSVRIGDVVGWRNFQAASDGIDPLSGTFKLSEVSDWSFVKQEVALPIRPLAAKFLIAEDRLESGRFQNGRQGFAVFDCSFDFTP